MCKRITNGLVMGVLALALASCEEDEPKQTAPPSTALDGTYDLVAYRLEKEVDLNRDGVFSHDLFKEMEGGPITDKSYYHMSFLTIVLEGPPTTDYFQRIDLRVPWPHLFVDNRTQEFLYNGYGVTWIEAQYSYSIQTGMITTTPHNGHGKILAASWDEASAVMSIRFEQEYYTTDWEKLIITGTYQKRP